jgi:hypothetical protein
MTEQKFFKGDLVKWGGVIGKVTESYDHGLFPVFVSFGRCEQRNQFTEDGRVWDWHKEPSLILVERPKKKIKKTFYFASWASGCGLVRWTSDMHIGIQKFNPLKQMKDFQIHEIILEVDDE